MVFQNRGWEFVVKLTETFKKRVRLFVQKAYALAKCPSNYVIKKMFPDYDLRKISGWMSLYAIAEDKFMERFEPTKKQYNVNLYHAIAEAAEKYGCVIGKSDFLTYKFTILKEDAKGNLRKIGRIGTDLIDFNITYTLGDYDKPKEVKSVGQAFYILIALFQKEQEAWSSLYA